MDKTTIKRRGLHAIAALLGHTSTKPTEVYTRTFNRQITAASAIAKLRVDV